MLADLPGVAAAQQRLRQIHAPMSLNEIAEGIRNLLVQSIGDHIELKLRLDPSLGLVKRDPVQVQ